MRSTARILAAFALLSMTAGEARAGWTQLRSQNFFFIGDASERTIRATAQKVEQFREVMLRAIPGAPATSPVPTVVLVFGSDGSFTPYKPRFEGRTVEAAGLFLQSDDINYILVNAGSFDQAFKVVFHEYSHFLLGNWSEEMPVWLNEGMAEVYATFQERDGGKSAVLGMLDRNHLGLLQDSPLIPLRELIAIDHTSPTYNEGTRRGVLYAQSWALVHYLMFGEEARRPQLQAFMSAIRMGTQAEQAFGDAFGDVSVLDKELRNYIRRFRFPAIRVDFGERVDGGTTARGEPIPESQASAYLGDVLARLGRVDAARALLRALVDKDGGSARAACALGLIELREKRYDEALPLLERAATLAPDDAWIQTALGDALIRRSEADSDADSDALLERARAALSRAAGRDDASAQTLATFGRAHLFDGGDPARAFASLERAVKLVPGREDYRVLLAHALLLQHEYSRATSQLGPLVARASRPEIRDQARRLLAAVSRAQGVEMTQEQAEETSRAQPAGTNTAQPDEPAPAAAAEARPLRDEPERPESTTVDARAGARSRRMGSLPVLRAVKAGETRVFGIFASVDCTRDGLVLKIDADRRVLRLSAGRFEDVAFISYRKDGPRGVLCGDQRPLFPVLATFRAGDQPGGGIDGTAVAIEVVEDDFLPPQ
jgi:tetratricopeptide (TPR) repeat protein